MVQQAYMHLHDLDCLQECDLARLLGVVNQVQPNQMMSEGQSLRGILIAVANRVIDGIGWYQARREWQGF